WHVREDCASSKRGPAALRAIVVACRALRLGNGFCFPLQQHQTLWVFGRNRAKHYGVDEAEDRSITANAQRQRDYRDGRKPWALAQQAQRVTKVLEKC